MSRTARGAVHAVLFGITVGVTATGCGDPFTTAPPGGGGGGEGGGAGGMGPVDPVGCSDGDRESFLGHPSVAGCQGAWSEPGVLSASSRAPRCDQKAGNTGDKSDGLGCSVADLCAPGWHVCDSAAEVGAAMAECPTTAADQLWITRQTTSETLKCVDPDNNNLVGCGSDTAGVAADASCAPLNRLALFTHCDSLPGDWSCGTATDGDREGDLVVKGDPSAGGGVLCCLSP
jgi:hypothetical protein